MFECWYSICGCLFWCPCYFRCLILNPFFLCGLKLHFTPQRVKDKTNYTASTTECGVTLSWMLKDPGSKEQLSTSISRPPVTPTETKRRQVCFDGPCWQWWVGEVAPWVRPLHGKLAQRRNVDWNHVYHGSVMKPVPTIPLASLLLPGWYLQVLVTQLCPTLWDPWTVALKAPLSMEFSRQEYWSGLPFPSTRTLPDPGIELGSPALQADSLPSKPPGKPQCIQRQRH